MKRLLICCLLTLACVVACTPRKGPLHPERIGDIRVVQGRIYPEYSTIDVTLGLDSIPDVIASVHWSRYDGKFHEEFYSGSHMSQVIDLYDINGTHILTKIRDGKQKITLDIPKPPNRPPDGVCVYSMIVSLRVDNKTIARNAKIIKVQFPIPGRRGATSPPAS